MPGPLNKNHTRHQPFYGEKGTPNRKAAKRLARRQNSNDGVPSTGYYPIGVKTGFFRKPGSQNRTK